MTESHFKHHHSLSWPSQHYQPQDEQLDLQRYVRIATNDLSHLYGESQGQGLAEARVAELIEEVLFSLDTQHYFLIAWCIMPNALLAIVELTSVYLIRHIVDNWKSAILKLIRERGVPMVPLWHSGYVIEHCSQQQDAEHYREKLTQMPEEAGLVQGGDNYYWSNGRYA